MSDNLTAPKVVEPRVIPADMPAGYDRDEAKRKITDQHAEAIEQMSGDNATFDPGVFDIENEIAQHYNFETNEFEVIDAVEGYSYLWGLCLGSFAYQSHAEIMGRAHRLLGPRAKGYELVCGPRETFPECWEMRHVDGTRRIGDVQLYRIRSEYARAIEVKRAMRAKARELGASSQLLAKAERYSKYAGAIEVEGDPHEYYRARAQNRGGIPRKAFDREMIMTLAEHKISEDARTGNLFGIPVTKAVPKKR